MVGLGVGIDYALLMLTRILEHPRRRGVRRRRAHAATTAGRSVVLAGTTVLSRSWPEALGPPDPGAFGFTPRSPWSP
jgi:RND superfamily putative drug exporter